MPYKFKFYIGDNIKFQSNVESMRCEAMSKDDQRCKNKVCIGSPYCWVHLLHLKHLRIKESNLADAGKGLFAVDPSKPDNAVIFKKNDLIVDYGGEIISGVELVDRYGEYTAPYGVILNQNRNTYEDAALKRGAGSLANQNPIENRNNAFLMANYRANPQKIQVKAEKNIKNNKEIYVDYGDEYDFDDPTRHTTK